MSSLLQAGGASSDGWWAIDVAGYLLTRLEALPGDNASPPALDADVVVAWIRRNELTWAPGTADPASEIPWSRLHAFQSEADLVEYVLSEAAAELGARAAVPGSEDDARFLALRRLIPVSSLYAYGLAPHAPIGLDGDVADGHVHQGAALPFEVTLRWVAMSMKSIEPPDVNLALRDTMKCDFAPLPLLLLLRNLLERRGAVSEQILRLATEAAQGDAEAWSRFDGVAGFDSANRSEPFTMEAIADEKLSARTGWTELRRIARLRVEAILLGAVTQREAGLEVFVELFEQFSKLRRGRLPKPEYFQRSIAAHSGQSHHRLRRLELRLGERVASTNHSQDLLERVYEAALSGYQTHIKGPDRAVEVTFPLGLVKSKRRRGEESDHWRFDPRGIYTLTEALLDVMREHPSIHPFVDGIDVCGLEVEEPNWLFACAFERFATATADMVQRPTCRFHAGEWQWTPLHGLRRIGEFMLFPLPSGTPRRVGHGLALKSNDWKRLGDQPLHELLDDLVWTYVRVQEIPCAEGTRRLLKRLILDLRRVVYLPAVARKASVEELANAYLALYSAPALERISFIESDNGRLTFPDRPPASRNDLRSQLLVAHLAKDTVCTMTVAAALESGQVLPAWTVFDLHATLLELYELLVPEIIDDLRWGGAVVEACPTSNVLAGGVRGYARHPMRMFVEAGVLTTINTDDPSVFHSWMHDEIAHAEHTMTVPSRSIARSRELSLRVVAPGLKDIDIHVALNAAISSLEAPRIR